MSDLDDLDFGDDEENNHIPDDEALREWLDAMDVRGFGLDYDSYVGFNAIPDGEALRGVTFSSPGEAFDHYRDAGVPAEMVHVVWVDDDTWQVYISGSP